MKKLSGWWMRGLAGVRELGPYAALELLLPGGTILAVLLWLYRRHQCNACVARVAREGHPRKWVSRRTPAVQA